MGLKWEDLDPRGQRSRMFQLDTGKENADNDDNTDDNCNGVYNEHKFSHTP